MKKFKKLLVVLAVLTLTCLSLAACGGASMEGDPAVGNWTMTKVEYAGQTLSADDLKSTGMMDEMPSFEINEDTSCTFTFMDQSGDGNVVVKDDGTYELTDDSDSDETITFEIKDNTLRLDYPDYNMVMIFEQQ